MNGLVHPIEVKCGTDPRTGKPRYVKCWSLRKAARMERRARDGSAPLSNPTSAKATPKGLPIQTVKRYEAMLNVLMRRAKAVQIMDAGKRKRIPFAIFNRRKAS